MKNFLKKNKYAVLLVCALIIVFSVTALKPKQTEPVLTDVKSEVKIPHPFYVELQEMHKHMMMGHSMEDMAKMEAANPKKVIAVLLYDGFAMLDAVGPMEALGVVSGDYKLVTVAKKKGEISTEAGIKMIAEYDFTDVPTPDVILVPGGLMGTIAASKDEETIAWIREADKKTTYTTSVCTGSWILAAAGVLNGKNASTHWSAVAYLEKLGATYTGKRYTEDGKYITAAGVSGGIDMGIALVAKLKGDDAGKVAELIMEYDPQPPFDAGSPAKADPELVEIMQSMNNDHIKMAEEM